MNRPCDARNWYRVLAKTTLLLVGLWFGCLDARSADAMPATKAIAGQEHAKAAAIVFSFEPIDFRLDSSETPERHAPETMAGGVAVFDYNNDGKLDIFFANGADINTLRKDSPKYYNRLFENDGKGHFNRMSLKKPDCRKSPSAVWLLDPPVKLAANEKLVVTITGDSPLPLRISISPFAARTPLGSTPRHCAPRSPPTPRPGPPRSRNCWPIPGCSARPPTAQPSTATNNSPRSCARRVRAAPGRWSRRLSSRSPFACSPAATGRTKAGRSCCPPPHPSCLDARRATTGNASRVSISRSGSCRTKTRSPPAP